MNAALDYLLKLEWSMGCGGEHNKGQCPDCCGCSLSWVRGSGYEFMRAEHAGHKPNCPLAAALVALGETPLMRAVKGDWEQT